MLLNLAIEFEALGVKPAREILLGSVLHFRPCSKVKRALQIVS